jgi:hypothetical protein
VGDFPANYASGGQRFVPFACSINRGGRSSETLAHSATLFTDAGETSKQDAAALRRDGQKNLSVLKVFL